MVLDYWSFARRALTVQREQPQWILVASVALESTKPASGTTQSADQDGTAQPAKMNSRLPSDLTPMPGKTTTRDNPVPMVTVALATPLMAAQLAPTRKSVCLECTPLVVQSVTRPSASTARPAIWQHRTTVLKASSARPPKLLLIQRPARLAITIQVSLVRTKLTLACLA
jgi:hypothetical protein